MEVLYKLLTMTDPVTATALFVVAYLAYRLKGLVVTGPYGVSVRAIFGLDDNEKTDG